MTTTKERPQADRFDAVPVDLARVGAHRTPKRRGRGFVTFAWAALATGLLVGAGVLGLGAIERGVTGGTGGVTGSAAAVTSAAPAATVDPDASVLVLNGTTTDGLAAAAKKQAGADGWKSVSTATASENDVKASTVYYPKSSQQGAALGLAKTLGITRTAQTDQYDRITVVLGSDWVKKA